MSYAIRSVGNETGHYYVLGYDFIGHRTTTGYYWYDVHSMPDIGMVNMIKFDGMPETLLFARKLPDIVRNTPGFEIVKLDTVTTFSSVSYSVEEAEKEVFYNLLEKNTLVPLAGGGSDAD